MVSTKLKGMIYHAPTFLSVLAVVFSLWTAAQFWRYYAVNVENVQAQPMAMANWLRENTPPDAVVAVHDVGMMRYIGERTTVDMVGLTTAGAADSWRNGPGAVAEFLIKQRPDVVAAYTTARGLNYLADTGIYGEELARFTAAYDERVNVALGATFQGIYQSDWSAADRADKIQQPSSWYYVEGLALVDEINVADLESERAHGYQWRESSRWTGFTTEVYEMSSIDCGSEDCTLLDGGRRFDGEESFVVAGQPELDLMLVTRVHPAQTATFDVYVNGVFVATRWIPAIPGQWLEITTLIPAEIITSDQTVIRIVPDGVYMPYRHWVYQGDYAPAQPEGSPLAQFGGLTLASLDIQQTDLQLEVHTTWYNDGSASGDGVLFVHVYDDVNQAPIAQASDRRLAGNTLPPGNLLAGIISDTFVVNLTTQGEYQITIGMYDPITGERVMPLALSDAVTVDENSKRLFIKGN